MCTKLVAVRGFVLPFAMTRDFALMPDVELEKKTSLLTIEHGGVFGQTCREIAMDQSITYVKDLWRKVICFITDYFAEEDLIMSDFDRELAYKYADATYALFVLRQRQSWHAKVSKWSPPKDVVIYYS
jgi:hypothetical protein